MNKQDYIPRNLCPEVPPPYTASITVASNLKADMVFSNPTTGKEMVRISSDGFYVHGKKLDQPETEARELYDAMIKWCNVRI